MTPGKMATHFILDFSPNNSFVFKCSDSQLAFGFPQVKPFSTAWFSTCQLVYNVPTVAINVRRDFPGSFGPRTAVRRGSLAHPTDLTTPSTGFVTFLNPN